MAEVQTVIGSAFPRYVGKLIDEAKQTIDIVVFDWRWYPNTPGCAAQIFSHKIITATRRKVRVRVVGNHEDTLAILRAQGVQAKKLETARLVHVKLMIIDGKHTILGSHNYTQSAFSLNFEASAHIASDEVAAQFEQYFSTLWQ